MLIGGEEVLAAIVSDDALPEYNRGCKPAPTLSYTMSAVKLTVLATVALLGVHMIGAKPVMPGGVSELENLEDAEFRSSLAAAVSKQNAAIEIIKIISAKTQVVAGLKYIVEFEGRVRPSDQVHNYILSYVMQPWISKEPQYVEFNTKS
ncbi:cystatin Pr17a-like isoform X2 [Rhodnius prolixus]|uniref:cystatin Pr17a-like isoform X2 n=1 Tax=Rhodnius prolixus TaxID=13249 RepID=UPI003D189089